MLSIWATGARWVVVVGFFCLWAGFGLYAWRLDRPLPRFRPLSGTAATIPWTPPNTPAEPWPIRSRWEVIVVILVSVVLGVPAYLVGTAWGAALGLWAIPAGIVMSIFALILSSRDRASAGIAHRALAAGDVRTPGAHGRLVGEVVAPELPLLRRLLEYRWSARSSGSAMVTDQYGQHHTVATQRENTHSTGVAEEQRAACRLSTELGKVGLDPAAAIWAAPTRLCTGPVPEAIGDATQDSESQMLAIMHSNVRQQVTTWTEERVGASSRVLVVGELVPAGPAVPSRCGAHRTSRSSSSASSPDETPSRTWRPSFVHAGPPSWVSSPRLSSRWPRSSPSYDPPASPGALRVSPTPRCFDHPHCSTQYSRAAALHVKTFPSSVQAALYWSARPTRPDILPSWLFHSSQLSARVAPWAVVPVQTRFTPATSSPCSSKRTAANSGPPRCGSRPLESRAKPAATTSPRRLMYGASESVRNR